MQVEIKYAKKCGLNFFFFFFQTVWPCMWSTIKSYFPGGVDMKIADSYIFPPHVFCLGKIDTKETL